MHMSVTLATIAIAIIACATVTTAASCCQRALSSLQETALALLAAVSVLAVRPLSVARVAFNACIAILTCRVHTHDITAGLRTDHTASLYSFHWVRAVPVHAQSEAHQAERDRQRNTVSSAARPHHCRRRAVTAVYRCHAALAANSVSSQCAASRHVLLACCAVMCTAQTLQTPLTLLLVYCISVYAYACAFAL
eukprot:14421-Heterococcus_DN1.PRE.1